MASFFRDVISNANRSRDNAIKESLINNLSECVKEIQFNNQSEDRVYKVLESDDSTNSLCNALEAIFLHGLKDGLFRKAKIALGADVDGRPQPNFWPLILVLSHRQSIEQISKLSQITTDIGQCRAWLRIALNDCLLSSYFSTLIRNIRTIKPFYNPVAFIRDVEILDVAQRLIEGLESCAQFNLPINSSVLNNWPEQVLVLTGIWMPTLKSCPITTGVDIASILEESDAGEEQALSAAPLHPPISGLGQMLAFNEDEAINFLLSDSNADAKTPEKPPDEPIIPAPNIGNSLSNRISWSETTAQAPEEPKTTTALTAEPEPELEPELIASTVSTSSHSTDPIVIPETSSLDEVSLLGGSYDNTPNIHEMMKELHKELRITSHADNAIRAAPITRPSTSDDPLLEGLGFEVISNSMSSSFNVSELQALIKQLTELARERGLDSQNYQCKSCDDVLGTSVSKVRVCSFTGDYYCPNCMDSNVYIIPAKVIHNWDFRRYPISKRSATFILEFQHYPLIDVKKTNPLIYTGIDTMCQLRTLRIQLNFLRSYIFTCREPIIEDFQKRVWPREYLYEYIHTYSITDLNEISNGALSQQLEKIVLFARGHVKECWLCSQKGFICEICNDPKVLYPFNTSSAVRCDDCSSVYHTKCLNATRPCPKCERKRKREEISLIEALNNKN